VGEKKTGVLQKSGDAYGSEPFPQSFHGQKTFQQFIHVLSTFFPRKAQFQTASGFAAV
jgi:hypothetical protein